MVGCCVAARMAKPRPTARRSAASEAPSAVARSAARLFQNRVQALGSRVARGSSRHSGFDSAPELVARGLRLGRIVERGKAHAPGFDLARECRRPKQAGARRRAWRRLRAGPAHIRRPAFCRRCRSSHALLQRDQAAPHPALHRAERHAELAGHLAVREPMNIGQHHHRASLRIEPLQAAPQARSSRADASAHFRSSARPDRPHPRRM